MKAQQIDKCIETGLGNKTKIDGDIKKTKWERISNRGMCRNEFWDASFSYLLR